MSDEIVWTTAGDKPRSELQYRDDVKEDGAAIYTTRVWLHQGVEVRWDKWVDMKQGASAQILKGM